MPLSLDSYGTLTFLDGDTVAAGQTFGVIGTGFAAGLSARWNGQPLAVLSVVTQPGRAVGMVMLRAPLTDGSAPVILQLGTAIATGPLLKVGTGINPPPPPPSSGPVLDRIEPASGVPGSTVAFIGRNLLAAKGYVIWTVTGNLLYKFSPATWSDTRVTMAVPVQGAFPGAITGPVYLRRADGQRTEALPFTVGGASPPPPPPSGLTITGYSSGNTIQSGQQFGVLGSGFNSAPLCEWGGLDLRIVRGTATELTIVAPDEEGTEVVTVRQGNEEASGPPLQVTTGSTPPPPPPPSGDRGEELEVIRLLNVERQKAGLMPFQFATASGEVSEVTVGGETGRISWMNSEGAATLRAEDIIAGMATVTEDTRLATAARDFAAELLRTGILTHTGVDGSSPGDRMKRAGYPLQAGWGENAAAGFSNALSVMNAWMQSPGHRSNCLSPQFRCVGIGKGGTFWVMDLAG